MYLLLPELMIHLGNQEGLATYLLIVSVYKKEWKDWGYWLGAGTVALSIRECWSFEKARACVQDLKLRSREEMG